MNDLKTAFILLQQNNFKITKQRRYLLEFLANNSDYYMALSHLDQKMRTIFPKMSHDTVYRNVQEMQSIGILETKMFKNGLRVKFQCDFQTKEHSHFICQQCGRAIEMPLPDFQPLSAKLENYQINTYHIEILGLCDKCQKHII